MKKTYNKKSKEDKEKEVNELLKKANEGIENYFTTPEHFKELASYMSKFYNYSFRNIFLIQEQFEGALAVGSYAFWKEKGFTVNKGEKGIKILVPNKLSDYFINEKGEEVKLSKATFEEKRLIEQGEIEVRKGKLIFNQGYVFEVSQTNAKAEDLPKIFPGRWLDEEVQNYDLMYKAMENIAKKIGVRIIEPKGELGAVKGVSYPLTKEVALNPRNTQLQNVKTLIHELAHAKLHTIETRDNYTTNEKEFQAEMSAYSVCSYFGLDTSEYSFRYIKSWTENVELKYKEKLINEVRETVKEYIEIIEETLINSNSLLLENKDKIEQKLEDEKLINFLGKDRVVINEITRDELEKIINENDSNIFLENEKELSIKNEVVAMKVKGKYRDVYIGTDYKLDNLIYVDDNKNLYRIKENIEYDKSLYGIKEQEIMKDLEEKSIESDDWKLTDRDLEEISFKIIKNNIEALMKENYGDFVRAMISIETGIEDLDLLDNIYEKYMDSDFKFINDRFEDLKNEIERENLEMRDEKKEKEIWRKIREHEEWVKSNGLMGKKLDLENENLKGMRLINLDLREANFKGADMTQCIVYADLRGADLRGAKIDNSEWIGSNINNITIEANKLNLIEYQMEQEKDLHLAGMDKLKTKTREREINM